MTSFNLEDIVDMEWLNSDMAMDDMCSQSPSLVEDKDEVDGTFSAEYFASSISQPLFWEQDMLHPDLSMIPEIDPLNDAFFTSSASHPTATTEPSLSTLETQNVKSEIVMPTTEQIRQLIEIAKAHLALRESQELQSVTVASQETSQPIDNLALFDQPNTVVPSDTIDPETLMKKEPKETTPTPENRETNFGDEVIALEEYARSSGIDIKKLTPKERRQLRNKVSARNFRVRRKEYITTLENKVEKFKKSTEELQAKFLKSEQENKQLRQEVDSLRRQNQLLIQQQQQQQQQQTKVAASPSVSPSVVESAHSPSSSRASTPLPKPNLNKDVSMLGTKACDSYRFDTRILVSNAVMPVWNFDDIIRKPTAVHTPVMLDEPMKQLIGQALVFLVQAYTPLQAHTSLPGKDDKSHTDDLWVAPLLPDDGDFAVGLEAEKAHGLSGKDGYLSPDLEHLYDKLIMSALMTNANVTDKSFWWWWSTPCLV